MQFVLDVIRKIVVLVLLMEWVIQLQPGKSYEPYIKMLVGIMVVYSIISGIGSFQMPPMQEFVWSDAGVTSPDIKEGVSKDSDFHIRVPHLKEIQVEQIVIEEIDVKEIELTGGTP